MAVPEKVLSPELAETFGGVTYHITGELVPVLNIDLTYMPVYFEHHVLLWKHTTVDIGIKNLQGAFKRLMAGLPLFITEAKGPGSIGFSRDSAGHIISIHLKRGESIDVREHQFLAATDSLSYDFKWTKGAANVLFGGTGFFIDTFSCHKEQGILWLHGYGNVFEVHLKPGEQIDIEPGGWIYKDHTVKMDTMFQKLSTGFLAAAGQLFWNRFTGPGKVGIQSMSYSYSMTE